MKKQDIAQQLRLIAADVFKLPVEDVVMDLRVGMIEAWDSMGHLELFMALESALKIKFTTDEIMSLESLKEIEDNLLNKLSL